MISNNFSGRSLIYGARIQNEFELHCTTVFGGQGRANGELTDPSGLVIDSGGNVISADSKNDRIQVHGIDLFLLNIVISYFV